MTRAVIVLAAAGLLAAGARAQPGPTPGQSQPQAPAVPAPWQPYQWQPSAGTPGRPSPTPGQSVPQFPVGGAPAGGPKVCVTEPKPTTRVVYDSVCKEYCAPRCCSVLGLIRRCFGLEEECDSGGCGDCELRTRSVLVKKVVPGPDVPTCVLKDAAACAPGPARPAILAPTMPLQPVVVPPAVLPYRQPVGGR